MKTDPTRIAEVLRPRELDPTEGLLLLHVDEQGGRLVPGCRLLTIPVRVGQEGLEAALFAATQDLDCVHTVFFGPVMISVSRELLGHIGRALQPFLDCAPAGLDVIDRVPA